MATDQNMQPANTSGVSLDRHILAILEPTISLDEMKFDANGEDKGGVKQSRENGTWAPHIRINNFYIPATAIRTFVMDCAGFMPIISFSFDDIERFSSFNIFFKSISAIIFLFYFFTFTVSTW